MTLFFGYDDYCRCLAHPQTEEELFQLISKFLEERGYKSYYTRNFKIGNVKVYDVGSWNQFFYTVDKDLDLTEDWDMHKDTVHYDISEVGNM